MSNSACIPPCRPSLVLTSPAETSPVAQGIRGSGVQHYFFDLHFDGEQVVDEDGIDHFDVGSAVYYGQTIADRIGRDADYRSLKVHVRSPDGAVLAIVATSAGRGREQMALLGR
jgi:hypothetical protein